MIKNYLRNLIEEIIKYPAETEWIEFKKNNFNPHEIGEYISALANSAAILGKVNGYLIWGISDSDHDIVGSDFNPKKMKVGNEELENWLLRLLRPNINFKFYQTEYNAKKIVLLEINAASHHPVQFKGVEYIRVGSYKKKLKDYQEKEKELWRIFENTTFELIYAQENIEADQILRFIDFSSYFELLNKALPDGTLAIIEALSDDNIIKKNDNGLYNITNLGAILFANNLDDFFKLKRKKVRIIQYEGINKLTTRKEKIINHGYASGFERLMEIVLDLIPGNEQIGNAIRKNTLMFPPLALRELVANALIHQDFFATGTGTTVEIFSNRVEITNPGIPLVKTDRFLDSPPKSRNENIASLMRRIGICEERGSGIDKAVFETELYQLPAPVFEVTDEHTRVVLFEYKNFWEMENNEKVWGCYLHACLKFVQREFMTNTTLRDRFGVDEKNSAAISRIIRDAMEKGMVLKYDIKSGRKYVKYIPWWARQ